MLQHYDDDSRVLRFTYHGDYAGIMQEHESPAPKATLREAFIVSALAAEITTLSFEGWMKAVDHEIAALCGGLTSSDLPDASHRDAFDSGCDAKQWAGEVLLEAGFGDEFDEFIQEIMGE
jgi:hypothetical protein